MDDKLKNMLETIDVISLIEEMPGNVFIKNTSGQFFACNKNMLAILKQQCQADIIGKTAADLMTRDMVEKTQLIDNEVLRSNQEIAVEEVRIGTNGQLVIYLSRRMPLVNKQKEVIGILGVEIDITHLKKAKEPSEIAVDNNLKTAFIQNMQHDIRTPSAGLWSILNLLTQQERDLAKKEILMMVTKSSKQLLDLYDDIVEFGNVEDGKKHPLKENILDIRAIADNVLDLNKPAAFSKGLFLNLKITADVPMQLYGDEYRLHRILLNLLSNAVKFTDLGNVTIAINIKINDNNQQILRLQVIDTGVGIAPEKQHAIFEKFTKLMPTNTDYEYKGAGLGLYIVKNYVEELRGKISVDSIFRQGSTFTVEIPITVPTANTNLVNIEIDEEYHSPLLAYNTADMALSTFDFVEDEIIADKPFAHRVLLIEDDNICLFAEHNILSQLVDNVDTARTVIEAKEQLKYNEYDVVISDIGLKDGSSIDVICAAKTQLWSKNKNTPFIGVTAHRDLARHQEATAAGFKEITTKPLTIEQARGFLESVPLGEERNKLASNRPVLDIKLAMKRLGTKSEMKLIKSLDLLMATLAEDLLILKQAEDNLDITTIREINHKIMGALNYSGTPALQKAVQDLYVILKHDESSKISLAIKNIHQQVTLLEKAYYEFLDKLQQ